MALVLSCESTHIQIVQKYAAFYETRRFITSFTSVCHFLVLSQINPVHPYQSHFCKTHCNITLLSTLRPYRVLTKYHI